MSPRTIVIELDVKRLMVYGDSALVINQLNKDWSYSSEKMDAYCAKIRYGIETTTWYEIKINSSTSCPR